MKSNILKRAGNLAGWAGQEAKKGAEKALDPIVRYGVDPALKAATGFVKSAYENAKKGKTPKQRMSDLLKSKRK